MYHFQIRSLCILIISGQDNNNRQTELRNRYLFLTVLSAQRSKIVKQYGKVLLRIETDTSTSQRQMGKKYKRREWVGGGQR